MAEWTHKASPSKRAELGRWLDRACEAGLWVTFATARRTADQNNKLWPLLQDIADQQLWHGMKLTKEDWKLLMLDALSHELRVVPNVAGTGFVSLGRSSSKLSKQEFSDLIELIYAFGAERGVVWSEPSERAAA